VTGLSGKLSPASVTAKASASAPITGSWLATPPGALGNAGPAPSAANAASQAQLSALNASGYSPGMTTALLDPVVQRPFYGDSYTDNNLNAVAAGGGEDFF
jgi:hypothetical protein